MSPLVKKYTTLAILFILFLWVGICQGQTVSLMDLKQLEHRLERGRDTVFILNFWATWCVPCVEEIPHFLKFSTKESKGPSKLLFISLDSPSKLDTIVSPFAVKHHMLGGTSEVYVLNERNQQRYIGQIDTSWSGAIPASLFVTDNGRKRLFKEQSFNLSTLESVWRSFRNEKE